MNTSPTREIGTQRRTSEGREGKRIGRTDERTVVQMWWMRLRLCFIALTFNRQCTWFPQRAVVKLDSKTQHYLPPNADCDVADVTNTCLKTFSGKIILSESANDTLTTMYIHIRIYIAQIARTSYGNGNGT